MKIPLNWLENYIKLEHSPEEFGNILTALEFMQNGPITKIAGQLVIDLEVRQNRPDMLSIIGAAREYAAYIDKNVNYPNQLNEIPVSTKNIKELVKVNVPSGAVKRFYAVEIKGVIVKKSPKWLRENLEAYGIQSVNNIVDITNYVMLEYGIPMHSFDFNKLPKSISSGNAVLTLRMGKSGDQFDTWLEDKVFPTKDDIVLTNSNDKVVGIGGVIGEKTSGTTEKTKTIVLEAANYSHSHIRKSALRHNLITDSAMRHSKILPSNMVETAIKRALWLIIELSGGEIVKAEDYYDKKEESGFINFNINEMPRLTGVQFDAETTKNLLERLGIEVIETIDASAIGKNMLKCRIPPWRTDLNFEEDIVEEVIRLWGYDKIPFQEITSAAPEYGTPISYQLEDKIRDILITLGLDEYITLPLVKYQDIDKNKNQIKLENPLNADLSGLRTSISETLQTALVRAKKANQTKIAVFEVGKIYKQVRVGKYTEEKRIEALYYGYSFSKKIKPDFLAVLYALGLEDSDYKLKGNKLEYSIKGKLVAILRENGYELLPDNMLDTVDVRLIPYQYIQTDLPQVIIEDMSFVFGIKQNIGYVADEILNLDKKISSVTAPSTFKIDDQRISTTLKIKFEDSQRQLTRKKIQKVKNEIIKVIKNKFKGDLRQQ